MMLCHLLMKLFHFFAQGKKLRKDTAHFFLDTASVGQTAVLLQVADSCTGGEDNLTLLVVQIGGDHVQQSGLTFTVRSNQTDTVLFLNGGVDIFQNQFSAVIFTNVF